MYNINTAKSRLRQMQTCLISYSGLYVNNKKRHGATSAQTWSLAPTYIYSGDSPPESNGLPWAQYSNSACSSCLLSALQEVQEEIIVLLLAPPFFL